MSPSPAFSTKSKYPSILRGLASKSRATRDKAYDAIGDLETDAVDWKPNFRVPERDAKALLETLTTLRVLPLQFEWQDPMDALVFSLVKSPYPSLVPLAERVAVLESITPRARCGLLTLLAAIGSREAAAAFVRVLDARGWPKSYRRLFRELPKIVRHADVTLPALVQHAGPEVSAVLHAIVEAASAKDADVGGIASRLGPVAPLLRKRLSSAVRKARARKATQPGWRFSDGYASVRYELSGLLDLAGFLDDAELLQAAKQAVPLR